MPGRVWLIRAALAVIMAAAIHGAPAWAGPFDLYGLGARWPALGQAGVLADDAAAAHYNPAGVASAPDAEAVVGYASAMPRLKINDVAQDHVPDTRGVQAMMALPFDLGAIRAGAGAAVFIPDTRLMRVRLTPPAYPQFVQYGHTSQRFAISVAAGVRLWDRVSLGAGAAFLGKVGGEGVAYDLALRGSYQAARARGEVTIEPAVAPAAGATVRILPWLEAGVSYRGALKLDLALDARAQTEIADFGLAGPLSVAVAAANYWSPARLALGAALRPAETLALYVEGTYRRWRSYPGAAAKVDVAINIRPQGNADGVDFNPDVYDNTFAPLVLNDTFSPAVGAEWRLGEGRARPVIRGGYSYVPSPVPDDTGPWNYVDGPRHTVSLGLGADFADFTAVLVRPLSVDAYFAFSQVSAREFIKEDLADAYPALTSGGRIWAAGAAITVRFPAAFAAEEKP